MMSSESVRGVPVGGEIKPQATLNTQVQFFQLLTLYADRESRYTSYSHVKKAYYQIKIRFCATRVQE